MSNSKFNIDAGKSGKLPEKSNFAQTCNLLSQFMKEKGNLRNLTLGINGKPETLETSRVTTPSPPTIDSLNTAEKSGDLFPHYSSSVPDTTNNASCSKPSTVEAKAGQMTIFYGGKVLVFDDFPAEKVTEMLKANKVNHQLTGGYVADLTSQRCDSSIPAFDLRQSQVIGSDMPIARRASLNRFLEKRKDRATVRAPYQLNNPAASSPNRDQKELFDLNL